MDGTSTKSFLNALPFDPREFPRETERHYISASQEDLDEMLLTSGLQDLPELFAHISPGELFRDGLQVPEELSYESTIERLQELSEKTSLKTSFIGDQLPVWSINPIVDFVSNLRPLSTSYTPYQPERSQGTLVTHWIYQCAISALTGFEAINTSLYDRSFAIYEAIACAIRTSDRPKRVLLARSLFPKDLEVLDTIAQETGIEFSFVEIDPKNGLLSLESLKDKSKGQTNQFAAFVFPQVNGFGLLEKVDELTDFCQVNGIRSIASIDPFLLASGGLKPPVEFGLKGADFIVGDAQHLAIGANFGGPGLGLFGCRYHEGNKRDLRHTPGRYIGKAKDISGRDCFVMVLSTREQHIRKEKATSNVCSNQAFLATLAGANLLSKGNSGLKHSLQTALRNKKRFLRAIEKLEGISLAFSQSPCFNELVLETCESLEPLFENARAVNLQIGVEITGRSNLPRARKLLKVTFTDNQSDEDVQNLIEFFSENFESSLEPTNLTKNPPLENYLRSGDLDFPAFSEEELTQYYEKLASLNVSPDDGCYPLGSCTMKYNPMLNDWAAALPGFSNAHPQAPTEDVQGPLAILFEIQEWFKEITGLQGVTTQPVAGAQGELVGLKLFQAYHRHNGDHHRDIIFIPKSAHGTNFATAAMAGYPDGIIYLQANDRGTIDLDDFREKLNAHGSRLCGVMITNPNTSGIFEDEFKIIADETHKEGGLVYMDGANMNAIAGIVNLGALGVDAVHNNLHKTWTIPHGGGGPGDAIVGVSEALVDFLPGKQIVQDEDKSYRTVSAKNSIGSFHRHWGNFGHKVRAYSYLLRLGREGIPRMSSVAVLSARYLWEKLRVAFATLPAKAEHSPRMHEFILTLSEDEFSTLEKAGIPKTKAIPQIGKLFLDFGFHAPTVAFPEVFGLMIEPTESYTKKELDRFADAVLAIKELIVQHPKVLLSAPHFTPIDRVDEVSANRNLILRETIHHLPSLPHNRMKPSMLLELSISEIKQKIIEASKEGQG